MIGHLCSGHLLFFFFSSRRRHTRCSRDWSSDVCSSDLTAGRVVFNSILPEGLRRAGFENRVMRKRDLSELVFESYRRAGLASTVQFLDSLKEFGFRYATMGGVSIGVEDLEIPAEKASLLHDAEARVERFQRAYATGQITFGERYNKVIDAW